MEKMKISAIQMCSRVGDKQFNIDKLSQIIERDVPIDSDLIVLPEVWTVGWSPKIFQQCAEDIENSSTINFLSGIAKKYNFWIIGGSIILKKNGNFYNICPVINRSGELVSMYAKSHLYSYYGCDEGRFVKSGSNPVLVDIEGIKTGLTICYDIRFPEIYRAYRKAGADLLINCAAWGLKKPIPWECMTRCRAVENQTYMVALTQAGYIEDDEWNIGHSRIIDYKGETVSEIKDQKEGAMTAILDFKPMYEFREKCKCIDDIKEKYEVLYEKNI